MSRRTLLRHLLFVSALVCLGGLRAAAQTAEADPTRFKAEIEAFRQWDTKNAVPVDGVLFVGSSTIRLWPTATSFAGLPVINRGFGGSQISDVNHYIEDLVLRYRPAVVVFYAGDNDVNAGKSPERVAADYRDFTSKVLAARADTRIIFLAIKPSPARWALWPKMQEANERIRSYSQGRTPQLLYVDVATPMLTAGGQTQAHLYVEDGLHMTPAGYVIWTRVLAPVIAQARGR
jgi:lysophospholipase L1-like esterase